MQKIAVFEKVSNDIFLSALNDTNNKDKSERYEVTLPVRATAGSAGYDFFAPFDFSLLPNQTIKIPTGIRAKIDDGWFLAIFPRSGLGFKFRLQLDNTVGIIDSDYYYSDNQGHIIIKITNRSTENKTVEVKKGQGFAQGVFIPYGITYNDDSTDKRNGGFGSTTK